MTATANATSGSTIAAKLRGVRVGTREDLEVSRHVFRGDVSYILRDPITFQSHRFDPHDYAIFCAIASDATLGDLFDRLTGQGTLEHGDEGAFYQFILALHGLGYLRLPLSDEALLYRRHKLKTQHRFRQKLTGFLFLRVPLWNPDSFLTRTLRFARPLFSRPFFVFWLALMGAAAFVVAQNRERLNEPLEGLLAAQNLPLLWLTLIVLKAFHEFGHAYACKHYGGHVPEMGAYLILFTPCAYVDATACWGFTRKRERILVCLAGMYVESVFAASAALVWAFTESSMLHSLAYNVMFLASAITVLFNINPLMRYDGYYVLSDVTEVPNLRERAGQYLLSVAKRIVLGLPIANPPRGWRLCVLLMGFGIAAAFYRVALILGIAAILAGKWFFVGVLIGVYYVGAAVVTTVRRLTQYLIHAEETAPIRWRAAAVSVVALVGIPALVGLIPLPSHVHAGGIVTREHEAVVRALAAGVVAAAVQQPGRFVQAGDLLVELTNDDAMESLAYTRSKLESSRIRIDAFHSVDPVRCLQEQAQATALQDSVTEAERKLNDLSIVADLSGEIVECLSDNDRGTYLSTGHAVATLVSGDWQVRTWLRAAEWSRIRPHPGQSVEFRPTAAADNVFSGRVLSVTPMGTTHLEADALTQIGGGDLLVEPSTRTATEPLFEVRIALAAAESPALRFGSTGTIRFRGETEPLGRSVIRRVHRFLNRLGQN